MKTTVKTEVEIVVHTIEVILPIRYGTEDISDDFPLRNGDTWRAVIEVDTGKIRDWPCDGIARELHMKVVDEGTYILRTPTGLEIKRREDDYVPDIIPGSYGDYVELSIDDNGVITNWNSRASVQDFFGD